jgi:cystathionine gamma-lyase
VFAAPYHLPPGGPDPAVDSYGRSGNPTWRALEAALGELDGGECVIFPSGMAALSVLLRTVLRPGDLVIAPDDGYYLARALFAEQFPDIEVRYVPAVGPWTPETVAGARLVLVETPGNPSLDVCDIAQVARLTRAAGALLVVDNTTATPLGQRPLELGADVSLGSDTKAVAGHSDVLLGHLSTVDGELAGKLRRARTVGGHNPGPFEVWLAHRGLATLDLRLARQAENAAALVDRLRAVPDVSGLRWPGSPEDPGYAVAAAQMRRFGGVFSFRLPSAAAVDQFLAKTRLIASATSFGGLHSSVDRRAQWGDPVPPGFVRFSCGIEDPADLVADVLAALS